MEPNEQGDREALPPPSSGSVQAAPEPAARRPPGPDLDVCLASPIFHPEYSGGATRFRRYAPGLAARGVRMHVMAVTVGAWKPYRRYSGGGPAAEPAEAPPGLTLERVPIPRRGPLWQRTSIGRRGGMWRNKWAFESAILARCRNPSTRPDLVIWRYPLAIPSVRALRALRRAGVPMMRVVTIFDEPAGAGWKERIKGISFPVPFRFLDCVVVSSGVMRENLRKLGVRTRIEVIPHGVDLERFHPLDAPRGSAPARTRLGLDPEAEVVLFVGPITERKGVDTLAKAWDRIAVERPRAHLVLVGHEDTGSADGSPSFSDGVRSTLARGRGRDRVTFVGSVNDVEAYMRAADLLVLPSHREGMPNVVLEAFASGTPCVLTPFRGLSEEIGRAGEEYHLVDHDVDRLGEAVSALLADPARRAALSDAALSWVRENLALEKSLDRLAGLCREVAGVSRRPGFG